MLDFYRGRRVLITGHTGFKGTWMTKILVNAGADVVRYSCGIEKKPDFYALSGVSNNIENIFADIGDLGELDAIYNIGADDCDCITTGELVNLFCEKWGDGASWESKREDNAPHETGFLKLDCNLMKKAFGWKPKWHIDECMNRVITFNKLHMAGYDIAPEMDHEIQEYLDS